ncbi:fibronectin type III domain-containing protein [uncultured Dokdonia sp.]|uniref:fibronectin type III domain-containing protein n=1 Tax=uncultured Dokdonia sp. TaxID=575653 RepID=UPI0026169079|nr:fibronectin type III domain-containing protein [uncultured Dokdonia sp.]
MEIVQTKRYFLILLVAILIVNCGTDDSYVNLNESPTAFTVDVSQITDTSAKLNWTASTDSEGSTIFYDVFLEGAKVVDNITDRQFIIENLEASISYSGSVVASNPTGNETSSSFSFETESTPAPSQFTVSVINTDPYSAQISWTESVDPNGQEIHYNVYLGNEIVESGTSNLSYFFNELSGITGYSGFIEAINTDGLTTISDFSFQTGSKVLNDDVQLNNQQEVNSFAEEGINVINGRMLIGNNFGGISDVSDISNVSALVEVTGDLLIKGTQLENLFGLENIELSGNFSVLELTNNIALTETSGLENILRAHRLIISQNPVLTDITSLASINTIDQDIFMVLNETLTSLNGLQNITSVNEIEITSHDNLTSLNGFPSDSSMSSVSISNNNSLTNLSGISTLISISGLFNVHNNDSLTTLEGIQVSNTGTLRITNHSSLIDITSMSSLLTVSNDVAIANNTMLPSLEGLENFVYTSNSANFHSLAIVDNEAITNLDPLIGGTFSRGNVNIRSNGLLSNLCGIEPLINNIVEFVNGSNFAALNAYNPNLNDMANGDCAL